MSIAAVLQSAVPSRGGTWGAWEHRPVWVRARGRGIEEVLISPAAKEDIMGCKPKEKEELMELRFLEVVADGRRGATGRAKLPSGGGVEAISMYNSDSPVLVRVSLVDASIGT